MGFFLIPVRNRDPFGAVNTSTVPTLRLTIEACDMAHLQWRHAASRGPSRRRQGSFRLVGRPLWHGTAVARFAHRRLKPILQVFGPSRQRAGSKSTAQALMDYEEVDP